MEKCYSTDLTDAEWKVLEPYVPAPDKRGRPRIHSPREILHAVFYLLKSGCPWRLLPKDFPPWETVYWWFARWRTDATFERLNTALGERLRTRLGRAPLPSAGIADSQTTKTTGVGGEQRGYDANKKIRGRKRHLLWWTPRGWCSKPRYTAPRCLRAGRAQTPTPVGTERSLWRLKHLWLDAGDRREEAGDGPSR